MKLVGTHNIFIDSHGRFTMPVSVREVLKSESRLFITRGLDHCIFVFPESIWEKLEQKLKPPSFVEDNQRRFTRLYFSGASIVTFDTWGHIVIPKYLREYIAIKKKAFLIGVLDRLEIWDPDEYEDYASARIDKDKPSLRTEIINALGDESEKVIKILENISETPTLGKTKRKHLFICYSNKDRSFAIKLATDLTKKKITVWLDRWEMLPGDSLYDKIQTGIRDSCWFAIILSPDSAESKWCKKELHQAFEEEFQRKKVFVIPILYKDCNIPGFLKEKVYVNMSNNNYSKEFDYLMRRFEV